MAIQCSGGNPIKYIFLNQDQISLEYHNLLGWRDYLLAGQILKRFFILGHNFFKSFKLCFHIFSFLISYYIQYYLKCKILLMTKRSAGQAWFITSICASM